MLETGSFDVKYTLKSAVYQAALAAIYEGGDVEDLIEKLLRYIPECRVDVNDFLQAVGQGLPSAVRMLERELGRIFESTLPRAGVLDDLEDETKLNEWWTNFEGLLKLQEEEDSRNVEDVDSTGEWEVLG